jgi:hypothetical protein
MFDVVQQACARCNGLRHQTSASTRTVYVGRLYVRHRYRWSRPFALDVYWQQTMQLGAPQ